MESVFGYVLFNVLLTIVAPIVSSLLLAMALLKPTTPPLRRLGFHAVVMPFIFGLIMLWFRLFHNALGALFFYSVFVTAMYAYLQVSRIIRRCR